jgi:hypothetical protein
LTLEVDFDVFKALTVRRRSEDHTENDVLRELLGLSETGAYSGPSDTSNCDGFAADGFVFPNGTQLRGSHCGAMIRGNIENGRIVVRGEAFGSFSAAARKITGYNVNGWKFWECKFPGESEYLAWKPINACRS